MSHRGSRSEVADTGESAPGAYDLRLGEGTPAEAFLRLSQAIDRGELSIMHGKACADILERRLKIVDAERFRQRLELAEANAREGLRRLPASGQVVDASMSRAPVVLP